MVASATWRSTSAATLTRSGVTSGRMLGSKLVVSAPLARASAATTCSPCRGSTAEIEPTCRWRALAGQIAGNGHAPSKRGRVEIERIARAGLRRAAHDEGERRRLLVARREAQVDAVGGERGGERLAVGVGRQPRDEGGRRAEPRQADGDIIGRAAAHRVVAAVLLGDGNEIDQRLARNQNHPSLAPFAACRLTPAYRRS